MLQQRRVDPGTDKAFVCELHCQGNYASDTPWARKVSYEAYREQWFSTPQPGEFLSAVERSLSDPRTLAEVWMDDGQPIAFLWMTFTDLRGYGITFAEVNGIDIVESHRRRGIGTLILERAERAAREAGAAVLRAETGIENQASQGLIAKCGLSTYRLQYEKVIARTEPSLPDQQDGRPGE